MTLILDNSKVPEVSIHFDGRHFRTSICQCEWGDDTAILILKSHESLALQEATLTLQCPWGSSLQGESLS